jgi:hypothetical protein
MAKLIADLAPRFKVFTYDFAGDDSAAVAELDDAALLVIGSTPGDWPAALAAGVSAHLDGGRSLVILDGEFRGKSPSHRPLWNRLERLLGCCEEAPAPLFLFEPRKQPANHPVTRGVDPAAFASLSAEAAPRHLIAVVAKDNQQQALAWMTAYAATAPASRIGNVAVVPLKSTAALAAPAVRRLVLQAAMTATDNEDLIPADGMKVTP